MPIVRIFHLISAPAAVAVSCALLAGCLTSAAPKTVSKISTSPTTAPVATLPGGERAAKIIFRILGGGAGAEGSFDNYPTTATTPGEGRGYAAVRAYKPDNTALSTFPNWLTGVEVGISGEQNSLAANPKCANFAQPDEISSKSCLFSREGGTDKNCGAPNASYRISEVNCIGAAEGTGKSSDSIYVRAFFSRNTEYLGASENILAVVEYSATSFTRFQTDPRACMTAGGAFDLKNCADFVWQAFLRPTEADSSATPANFLTFVPPTSSFVDPSLSKQGGEIVTKQFVLPLAANPTFKVFQLSRIRSRLNSTDLDAPRWTLFNGVGAGTGICGNDSPLCAGLVIYSISFYRI